MSIRLFSPTDVEFESNGIGILVDAVTCEVLQELNGEYELEMRYPVTGAYYDDIAERSIIVCPVDNMSEPQPFRVYKIRKPINGIVAVFARHISYDMSGIPVSPFTASTLGEALLRLKEKASVACPFTFVSDRAVSTPYALNAPESLWRLMGGVSGSILDVYGGEWIFDRYSVRLTNTRGADRGVTIRYGKNLTDFQQDSDSDGAYTGVYPYWTDSNGENLVELPEKIVYASGEFDFVRVCPVNASDKYESAPTHQQLRDFANAYIIQHGIGDIVSNSWTLSFAMLEDTEEYKGKAILEKVYLGDTVQVEFPMYRVSVMARVVKVCYDAVYNRYKSVTFGRVRQNLADTIVAQSKEIADKPNRTMVEDIAAKLAVVAVGALGGYVRLLDTNGDHEPDELYIADHADPAQAVKVWRFNYQGWAASRNGYEGPFTMGATLENGLLADFVTAAHLTAGTIQSADGQSFYLDLDENILRMGVISELESNMDTRFSNVQNDIDDSITGSNNRTDALISDVNSSVDQKIAAEAANTNSKISAATEGVSDRINEVEAGVNEKLIPLAELSDYIQVGNIGTTASPVFGVKIGKRDLATAFKSIFTASALEFYENNVKTAFLSNQKLNTNTIRTAAMELVSSANMSDAGSVDWLVTMDNGFTIKYVGDET